METIITENTPETSVKKKKPSRSKKIPESCIYEIIDGKPVYYKGYKDVVKKLKTIEEIMGTSYLQSLIISCIVEFLLKNLSDEIFSFFLNEPGLHIDNKNEIIMDLAIFDNETLKNSIPNDTYLDLPPKVIIEIDTKADLTNFDGFINYFINKTNKAFDFGVEKVLWILTKEKKIISAKPKESWIITDWTTEIELMDDCKFVLESILNKNQLYRSLQK
jgi:hypothetical protein